MDLRAKIAEALYEAPDALVAESALGGLALGEATRRANRRANAVMEVVEGEIERQCDAFLQAAADQPGIPDYAYEALARTLAGEDT